MGLLVLGERSVLFCFCFCPECLFVFPFMRKKGPERLFCRRKLMKKFGSLEKEQKRMMNLLEKREV